MLLRYEKTGPGGRAETAEFTRLKVDTADTADPLLSPDLSDDQANLLYRSVLGPQKFAAILNEQADVKTMTRLVQAALAATELGHRTRWLWPSPADASPENVNLTARLQVAMPGYYRIDAVTDPGTKPAGVALGQIWHLEGHPVLRTELSAVTPDVDLAVFRIEPLPGTRVITGGLLTESGLSPAEAAWTAAKGTAKLATEIGRRWARRPRP